MFMVLQIFFRSSNSYKLFHSYIEKCFMISTYIQNIKILFWICIFSVFKRIFDGFWCKMLNNTIILYFINRNWNKFDYLYFTYIITYLLLRIQYGTLPWHHYVRIFHHSKLYH
jgi:hypothetical protein